MLKAIVLIVLALTLGMLGYHFYKVYDEFPEQARIENLNQQYAGLIADLNKAIALSDSADSLANELENVKYPPGTLAVSIKDKPRRRSSDKNRPKRKRVVKEIPIFNRIKSNNAGKPDAKSTTVINGGGYGVIDGQHFWILQHKFRKHTYDYIEVLFEREPPRPETGK